MVSEPCIPIIAASECWGLKVKNILKKALFTLGTTLLALILVPQFASAQTALTQTTLSATLGAQQTCFTLASVTGISGFGPGINNSVGGTSGGNGNITDLYIDLELMQVTSVNTTGKYVCVLRGSGGSQANAHVSGTMVLVGPPQAFYDYNPAGYCGGAANTGFSPSNPPLYTPWVNLRTGQQWLCSSDSLTWVPGFNNTAGGLANAASAGSEASAAGTNAVLGPVFAISGTNAIVTFTVPVGFNGTAVGGGCFTVIPKGIFTWTAAGNISVLGTTTAITQNVSFCWNPYTSKWVPSRVS